MKDTYHGYSPAFENPRDCEMWLEAMAAKFDGKGKPFGRKEFDKLLGHCQAVTDVPAVCFAQELIESYPEAKVILTHRDIDQWHASVKQNIVSKVFAPSAKILSGLAYVVRSPGCLTRPMFVRVWNDYFQGFDKNGKRVFKEHYALVRRLTPTENLLDFRVQEGWGPLCEFLGDPVPDEPFPKSNDSAEIAKRINNLIWHEFRAVVTTILANVLPTVVLVVAYMTYRNT
ncbi:MAG: hypothetical protein M1814_005807 [Vezdaea aestivalis]|nr:MAG: hypothetical protein M1814_005807 [Vezdaea aestivalis]